MSGISEFVKHYYEKMQKAAAQIDPQAVERVKNVFVQAYKSKKHFYTMGNGGSSAIADHFLCDLSKGTHNPAKWAFKSHCLSSNTSMMTAISNDIGYEEVFSRQLDYNIEPGDVAILISSSGNSPNVVKACELAKKKGAVTVALVGFSGGKLKDMADHHIWVPIDNYGIVEDLHQSLMHILTQYLTLELKEGRI